MPKKGWRKPIVGDLDDPDGLVAWTRRYVEELKVKGYSMHSVTNTRGCLLTLSSQRQRLQKVRGFFR